MAITVFLRRTRKLSPSTTTLLNGAITSSDTTITVDSATNYANSGMLRIENELITYTGKTATTFTGCVRGVEATDAAAHSDNSEVQQVRNEYLYLVVEQLEYGREKKLIAPVLPGNEADNSTGQGDSTNFTFDLGAQDINVRVTGSLIPIPAAQFPTLSPDVNCHVVTVNESSPESAESEGVTNSNTVSADQSGHYVRSRLDDFLGDTSKAGFALFCFGWPEWGATSKGSGARADVTLNGTAYRVFYGLPRALRDIQVAGEPDQSTYSFEFHVGNVEVFA